MPSPTLPLSRTPALGALALALAAALGLAACANPVAPSGGPRDTTPPRLVETEPEAGAVNVSGQRVRLVFSEYVDKGSFQRALSVTPQPERRLDIDWDGREANLTFPQPLRDSVTYILTLGTDLRDVNGAALSRPLTLAFATGPTIDAGTLAGRVVRAYDGGPAEGVDVYAYAAARVFADTTGRATVLPERPTYRTQTGTDGTFGFRYLREQPYFVVAVRDRNRSRQIDPATEPFAVPPRRALRARPDSVLVAAPWLVAAQDTVPPRLERARVLTEARFRVRFSEPVRLGTRAPEAWAPVDTSAGGGRVPVRFVFQPPEDDRTVVVATRRPMRPTGHRLALAPGTVADTLGQPSPADTVRFTPFDDAPPDTALARFAAFVPEGEADTLGAVTFLPSARPGARFTQPVDTAALGSGDARRVLVATDTTGAPLDDVRFATDDGVTYRARFEPPLAPGAVVELRVDPAPLLGELAPDTLYTQRFRAVSGRQLGALAGVAVLDTSAFALPSRPLADTARVDVAQADTARVGAARADTAQAGAAGPGAVRAMLPDSVAAAPLVVELIPAEEDSPVGVRRVVAAADGTFVFDGLPEAPFRFRAFLDRNRNGRWDGGQVRSFVPAEPVAWRWEPKAVRPRWETVLDDTLRVVPRVTTEGVQRRAGVPGNAQAGIK